MHQMPFPQEDCVILFPAPAVEKWLGALAPRSRRQATLGDQQVGEAERQRDPLRNSLMFGGRSAPWLPLMQTLWPRFRFRPQNGIGST